MSMLSSNKVRFSVLAMATVLILGIVGAGLIQASHTTPELYEEAGPLETLETASGVVFDWATTWDSASGERDWVISGEWTLDCHQVCDSAANLGDIEFDMAFAMVRDSYKGGRNGKGGQSHGHQFANFTATSTPSVSDDGDELTIEGIITGSGPIDTDEITVRLQ